jgi:hypothetical protein
MMIKKLLILPPLAFARLGSAPVPQPRYELAENAEDPLGFRRIIATKPCIVDDDGSLIPDPTDYSDGNAIFRDSSNRIRPVAPFFELYAITEENSEPVRLTVEKLKEAGLELSAIRWCVHVANLKVFRRTHDLDDVVEVKNDVSDHLRHDLLGECNNFGSGGHSVKFGHVQFIKPRANETIQLRFTPASGKIYGPESTDDQIYSPPDKLKYDKGHWNKFDQSLPGQPKDPRQKDGETWPRETLPPSLFAIKNGPPWLHENRAEGLGFFDDVCDGFISVSIGEELKARARICVGPPSFIPDCVFVRTLADDLDQVINGPAADDISVTEARQRALDMVRRGYEAVRFMNVDVMNGNPVKGREAERFDTMPAEESFGTERPVRPVMSPASMDTAAIMALHRQVYAALSAGAAPWFPRLLRKPNEMGDLTDRGRRKMPALMSGADSFYLAFTHRQIATVEKAAVGDANSDPGQEWEPRNLTAHQLLLKQLNHKAEGNPINSRPEMAIANCCPGLEVDFRAVWRKLFKDIELCEYDNYVVEDCRKNADGTPVTPSLKGRRLLGVGRDKDGKFIPVIAKLKGPSPSDPQGDVPVYSQNNPHGVWTMEWSNCLAHVVDAWRKHKATTPAAKPSVFQIECQFTDEIAPVPQRAGEHTTEVWLRVQNFFEDETAVISKDLAKAGELTQGLCSPWQNDLRECSCFYWASSRPDFVNMTIGVDGLSHGDNWVTKERVGEYVPDDYDDERLMDYKYLFEHWEKALQFQIGGRDSAPVPIDPSEKPTTEPGKP